VSEETTVYYSFLTPRNLYHIFLKSGNYVTEHSTY